MIDHTRLTTRVLRLQTLMPRSTSLPQVRTVVAGLAAVLTTAIILRGYAKCRCLGFQYDDAYITFRYAENLASGNGLVFNPGEATDSASSFAYTVLLAFFRLLGAQALPQVAAVIGIACAAATAAVVALACLERTRRPFLSLALAAAIGCNGLLSGWAISGMETLLFVFLVTLAVYRLFIHSAFGWFEALLIALVVLTRLEGALLATAWAALAGLRFGGASATQRRRLCAQAGFVAGVVVAFLLLKWKLYGGVLPHAFELKRVTELYAAKPTELWRVWRSAAPALLLLGASGLFTLPHKPASSVLRLYCLASCASVVWGPFADWARYSVHLVPLLAILAAVPLSLLLRELPVLAAVGCVLVGVESQASFAAARADFERGAGHARCREQVGAHLERALPAQTRVISSDIGAIAYRAPHLRFIDTVGLTSSDILIARAGSRSAEPILFAKGATVIADTCSGSCTQAREFAAYNWLVREDYWITALPEHEHYFDRLKQGSVLFRCQSPDGLWFAATQFVRE